MHGRITFLQFLEKICLKVLVNKNKCLPLYRDKEITQRTGAVPGQKTTKIMATFATAKQISYLQALADKVEILKENHEIKCPYIVWKHEKGVTTIDASIRISAYKEIIFWCNVQDSMR